MLSDTSYVVQSLIDNLFYLRTIREFCLNIQLSFYQNNQGNIETAEAIGKRCEELGKEAIELADGRIPNNIIDDGYFLTNYTLNLELLTEKLFGIDINTDLTVAETNFTGVDDVSEIEITEELLNRVSTLNQNSIELTSNFIAFCRSIRESMQNGNLFSYSYPLFFTYMIEEAALFLSDLERIQERNQADPTFITNFEYYYSNSMMRASQFIIGLSDPSFNSVILNADNYRKAFISLMKRYEDTSVTPESQKLLQEEAIELVENFKGFLSKIIEGILNNTYYFIVEPVFFDNLLTEANYFLYLLQGSYFGTEKVG